MGSCITKPAKAGLYVRKKRDSGATTNRARPQNSVVQPARKSVGSFTFPVLVLSNPAADNVFDKYRFDGELGRGEFGITHKCVEIETDEIFACKTISKSKLRTDIDIEDARREVEIMRHLPKHPNLVRLKEAYEDKEAVYLVMELCKGGELFDRIVERGHYTECSAAKITKTILEVCKVCHKNAVIHRDLKPENFLFADGSETSQLKAIDFGLSIFFEPGQRFTDIVGSPYYMAPEVLKRNYGPEVDIWSAGVILYILLCGVPPFWAETEEGIAQAIVQCNVSFERDPWSKVSEDAKELIKGMLEPNPYTRMSVDEALEHPWIQNANQFRNINLGDNVRTRIKQFSLMNKFKKKVLRVVAENLPDELMDGIKEMFQTMDTDKNGDLTFEELRDGLHMIGHPVTDPDVQMLFDAADTDGSGTINSEEFVAMSIYLRKIDNDELLSQAFRFFDKNQSGYIEFDELKEAMLNDSNGPENDQVIRDIINDVDMDKDGIISYKEFKVMMTAAGMHWKMASRQYSRALLNAVSIKIFKDKSGPLSGPLQKSSQSHKSGPLPKSPGRLQLSRPLQKSGPLPMSAPLHKSGPLQGKCSVKVAPSKEDNVK